MLFVSLFLVFSAIWIFRFFEGYRSFFCMVSSDLRFLILSLNDLWIFCGRSMIVFVAVLEVWLFFIYFGVCLPLNPCLFSVAGVGFCAIFFAYVLLWSEIISAYAKGHIPMKKVRARQLLKKT